MNRATFMLAYYEKKLFVNYFYFFLHNKTNNAKAAKQEKNHMYAGSCTV